MMGQVPSTPLGLSRGENSTANHFNSADLFLLADSYDHTDNIPDECLALIFQFLGSGDRKRCSLVCKRWFYVDGESRHRLSLNAQAEILTSLPSLFTRFNSITKLALRCDRKTISLNDDALILISVRCQKLTRLKLRGCREITDIGMATFAQNSKYLTKLSCGSCMFGTKAINAVIDHCTLLEELSLKRLKGIQGGAKPIRPGAAAKLLRSICLKELVNGQSFESLIIGSNMLKTLKIICCLGEWDKTLEMIGNNKKTSLIEVHLERLQVSDIGISGISKCANIENLHIIKTPEFSNLGLDCVAVNCKHLRKLHIDGWRTNRIGDEGLIAVSKHCHNLQELVLIGINVTHLSLASVAANCSKLERLALCGSATIGDGEMACIAAKCVELKKLCVKGCNISDIGIEAFAWGCPNLVKIKVKKCRAVSGEVAEWLQERRGSLLVNFDGVELEGKDVSGIEVGGHEIGADSGHISGQVIVAEGSSSGNGSRLAMLTTKLGLFAGRNFVSCAFRRWSNGDDGSSNGI